jgi:hypothetical protein
VKLWILVLLTASAIGAVVAGISFQLADWLTFCAAVPAGVGGALLGDRGMAWLLARFRTE